MLHVIGCELKLGSRTFSENSIRPHWHHWLWHSLSGIYSNFIPQLWVLVSCHRWEPKYLEWKHFSAVVWIYHVNPKFHLGRAWDCYGKFQSLILGLKIPLTQSVVWSAVVAATRWPDYQVKQWREYFACFGTVLGQRFNAAKNSSDLTQGLVFPC